jgi:Fur family ferric uptake transcriptional regulator
MSCITVLKEKGFKLTPQRRLILEFIHDNRSHLTAEDVLRYVGARAPGVDKSTVYRTLDLLEESGCVVKSEMGGHFIYHHAEDGHHHHLVCRSCGRSIDCYEDVFSGVTNILARQYGFKADLQHMMLSGLCKECRRKEN